MLYRFYVFFFVVLLNNPALVCGILLVELFALHITFQRPTEQNGFAVEFLVGFFVKVIIAFHFVNVGRDV